MNHDSHVLCSLILVGWLLLPVSVSRCLHGQLFCAMLANNHWLMSVARFSMQVLACQLTYHDSCYTCWYSLADFCRPFQWVGKSLAYPHAPPANHISSMSTPSSDPPKHPQLVICMGVPTGVQTSTHTHRPKGVWVPTLGGFTHGLWQKMNICGLQSTHEYLPTI